MNNKKRKQMNELPTLKPGMEIRLEAEVELAGLPENQTATPLPDRRIVVDMTVEMPFLVWKEGFLRRRLDCVLTNEQARKLKGIQLGLESQEAQLQNGKYVANPVDALRWLLENVEDAKTN